eukprot:7707457-Prorocentrum_lima.AAC.1
MTSSLVGSEMCIRDRWRSWRITTPGLQPGPIQHFHQGPRGVLQFLRSGCLLYTSDAADDM